MELGQFVMQCLKDYRFLIVQRKVGRIRIKKRYLKDSSLEVIYKTKQGIVGKSV